MKLEAFSVKPRCLKCGSRDISREYHGDDFYTTWDCVMGSGYHREHHDMYCRRCTFKWGEHVRALAGPEETSGDG
jgi:hypothetical protein